MIKFTLLISLILSVSLFANEKRLYVKNSFVHLKDFVSINSSYSKTLICGTPLELIDQVGDHYKVRHDLETGFVSKGSVELNPTECFQEKYPVFFQSLNIDNADLFYWGKLK